MEGPRVASRSPRRTDGNAASTATSAGDDAGGGERYCTAGIATRGSIRGTLSPKCWRHVGFLQIQQRRRCDARTREGPTKRSPAPARFGGRRLRLGVRRAARPRAWASLEQGDLRWLTLDLIAAQPRHGYEIIKAIEDALSGHYTPSPGVIYPTLTLLEETGLIVGEAQGSKKLYRLTDEGRTEVEAHAADIRAARSRLQEANTRFGGSPAPELIRAMNNLRAALQVRLAKGDLSTAALGVITAALDRAAAEIERS